MFEHHAAVVFVANFAVEPMTTAVQSLRLAMPDNLRHLVVGPIRTAWNGGATFVFAPCGSKPHREDAEVTATWRRMFTALFEGFDKPDGNPSRGVGVSFGEDDATGYVPKPEVVWSYPPVDAPPVTALYPRRLPNLPVAPHQYATESAPVYAQRVYRWRQWLDHDLNRALLGGPMQWYATTDEIKNYEAWRDQPVPAEEG